MDYPFYRRYGSRVRLSYATNERVNIYTILQNAGLSEKLVD